jgi:hypothetical protein
MLSITAFMLVQGITPVLRIPFENVGRRPVLIGTLFVFCGASIGLVFTRNFFVHLILRAIQAGGSAALATIGERVVIKLSSFVLTLLASGAAVVGDIPSLVGL